MNYLGINIDDQPLELPERGNVGLSVSYILEDADQFQQKSGSPAFGINVPATPANDRIFNTYHNPGVEDMSGTDAYTNPRKCEIIVGGITILKGKSLLLDASHTRIAAGYNINAYGQNGDWVIDMKDLSLWDCVNPNTHVFNVATVETSWGAFMIDEFHDYVYAPVRYRQPFGDDDDAVNIYHLRPSISRYWLIMRAFRQFGYTVESQFLNTSYYKGMTMPWTWGDFYDLNNQLIESFRFKAVGQSRALPAHGTVTSTEIYSGTGGDVDCMKWKQVGVTSGYVMSRFDGITGYNNFRINNVNPPLGFDNFHLYNFDDTTGEMNWVYRPPTELLSILGSNIAVNFTMNLIAHNTTPGGSSSRLWIEVTHIFSSGAPTTVALLNYDGLDLTGGGTLGSLFTSTPFSFTVNGVNAGDSLIFRLKFDMSGAGVLDIRSSGYFNSNPSATGANNWQYDGVTQKWGYILDHVNEVWQQIFSSLEMTGLQLTLGGNVNLQNYDKFREYRFMDFLGGEIDNFNLSIQTDPINKVVTIEPTHDYLLPGPTSMPGYFKPERIDWTDKQDLAQPNTMNLYSDCERQFDFQFKPDGSDGMQTIYSARYRGIYLANKIANSFNRLNNTNNDNGIKAGVPGASRYVFPERFRKGSRQLTNRFFSATMHYNHGAWKDITGVAPQLIAIIPENINDSSASAVSAIFEPKIAFYKGYVSNALYGGWRWIGDPNAGGLGIPTYTDGTGALGFDLPFMFAVNYGHLGGTDPVLSYCRQMINGGPSLGLMEAFFLPRLAIMRHGRQYKPWIRLNSGDMTDWEHRNTIIIGNNLYHLIGVDRWNPLSDNPSQCTMWKVAHIEQVDYDNSYPSNTALSGSIALTQFDIRYAPLLIYATDLPQS